MQREKRIFLRKIFEIYNVSLTGFSMSLSHIRQNKWQENKRK